MKKIKRFKRERKFKNLTLGLGFIFQLFLNFGFGIFIFFTIVSELTNFSKDTFGLTNYGFAIMLGLSSVCFSWARNLNKDQQNDIKRLMDNAIEALYGAIIFLMGSGFKYVALAKDNTYLSDFYSSIPISIFIPKIFAFICFVTAAIKFYNVIIDLLKIISVTNEDNWEKEIKNKEENVDNDNLDK